jgi:hypothetical protein
MCMYTSIRHAYTHAYHKSMSFLPHHPITRPSDARHVELPISVSVSLSESKSIERQTYELN